MKFNTSEIEAYQKKIRGIKVAIKNRMRNELNTITDRHLARVIKNTDVGDSPDSPSLRNRWDRTPVVETADGFTAEVINPLEYASYYEYGHRQKVGKVIFIELKRGARKYGQVAKKQKDGRYGIFIRLKKPFVQGRFVLTSSEQRAQQELDLAAKRIQQYVKEVFNG